MSHFTALIGLTEAEYHQYRAGVQEERPRWSDTIYPVDSTGILDTYLAPFDENMEVEPYLTDCWCVGTEARKDAIAKATKQLNWNWDIQRKMHWHIVERDSLNDDESQQAWDKRIQPYVDLEEKLKREHPLYNKPRPQCEDCNGTGQMETTYNPQSKWDWWKIGGSWRNDLSKFDCLPDGNAAYGHELAGQYSPSAIVIKDKKGKPRWSEKGEMGWFAIVTNENDNWDAIASELFTQFKDRVFVLVDCHI